jgi:hypothetical protein
MDADLRDLLAAWLGEADPGEERRAALLARLREDAAFREAFVAEIRVLGMIRAVQSAEPRWLRLEDALGWSARERVSVEVLAEQVVQKGRDLARLRKVTRRSLMAAVALVACAVLIAVFRANPPRDAPATPPVELARAVKVDGVTWEDGSAEVAEGGVVTAGRLRLASGRLTLTFFSGVSLTAEGPTDLELRGRDRVFCHRGKLRVRVAPGAEGFTVSAPGYEVVDLGTEFGLNVEAGGKTKLMVFDGEAAVSVLGADGRTMHSALIPGKKAVEVDPSAKGIREVAPQPEAFVRLQDAKPPALELLPDYRAVVLAAGPWGYWRFQQLIDGQVPNEVAGRPGLRVFGGVRLGGAAAGNRWAVFRESDPAQALLMDGTWAPPRAAGYAVELWVQPAKPSQHFPNQSALVSAIAATDSEDPRHQRHVSYVELAARGRQSLQEPCAARFLDRWPAATSGGVDVFSRRNVVPSDWHHIVGQKAGDTLELYVDGELVGTSPAKPVEDEDEPVTGPCQVLVGRLKQWSTECSEVRPFEGRLDELAIYDRPLSADEIRRHYSLRATGGRAAP